MAKTKAKTKQAKSIIPKPAGPTPEDLYASAITCLETSDLPQALEHAKQLLHAVDPDLTVSADDNTVPKQIALPALNLLGTISVEQGDVEQARRYFHLAVNADPEGAIPDEAGGGADKFLWLAQISEKGGADSVRWFQKGVAVLKAQIAALDDLSTTESDGELSLVLLEKRSKIATALCGVTEIYMTDLSWDDGAESQCEALITEALIYAPENAEVLQTVASVRLSQLRIEDARSALRRSLALWTDLDPEDDDVPGFAARISLARLLMEAELEDEAMDVLQRLALEDDQSVEACYLGGWCLNLLAVKRRGSTTADGTDSSQPEYIETLTISRTWLLNTLKLYQLHEYEDERLKAHTMELVDGQNKVLGPPEEAPEAEDVVEWDEAESSDEDTV